MSQPLGNFAKYIGTWYEHYVLPVIPVRATLKIKMDGSTVDPTQLGKVPGQRHRGEWSGFRDRHLNWFVDEAANDVDGVDFLGDGQETLTDGWHKTGAVLEWPNGDLLE